jgi:transcriptional regulator with XRE-family HTH domain
MAAMAVETFPAPIPGPDLEALRKRQGVTQKDLAGRLGIGRVTLHGWERAAEVDPIRAARYHRALRDIVAEATDGIAS